MLSRFKLPAFLICGALALTFAGGCADAVTGNPNITKANSDNIQKGVTTRDQLVQTFGNPNDDSMNLDGTHKLTFVYAQVHVQPGWQTYIPIWDLFKSDADSITTTHTLQTWISVENICITYTYGESQTTAHAESGLLANSRPSTQP